MTPADKFTDDCEQFVRVGVSFIMCGLDRIASKSEFCEVSWKYLGNPPRGRRGAYGTAARQRQGGTRQYRLHLMCNDTSEGRSVLDGNVLVVVGPWGVVVQPRISVWVVWCRC